MKLKTEIGDIGLMVNQCRLDEDNIEWYQAPSVCHDAAYAHAMLVAMADLDNSGDVCGIPFTLKEVERLASEHMAEWGYP